MTVCVCRRIRSKIFLYLLLNGIKKVLSFLLVLVFILQSSFANATISRQTVLLYSKTPYSLRVQSFDERKAPDLFSLGSILPDDAVQAIRDSHGGSIKLLPLQQEAIKAGILDPEREEFDHDVLLMGPTSAGKTDPAFWKALALYYKAKKDAEAKGGRPEGRYRSVFFEPSRALCAERARAFAEICEPLGIKVRVSNHDHSLDDADIVGGNL